MKKCLEQHQSKDSTNTVCKKVPKTHTNRVEWLTSGRGTRAGPWHIHFVTTLTVLYICETNYSAARTTAWTPSPLTHTLRSLQFLQPSSPFSSHSNYVACNRRPHHSRACQPLPFPLPPFTVQRMLRLTTNPFVFSHPVLAQAQCSTTGKMKPKSNLEWKTNLKTGTINENTSMSFEFHGV